MTAAQYVPRHGTDPDAQVARANTDWQRARRVLEAVGKHPDVAVSCDAQALFYALRRDRTAA